MVCAITLILHFPLIVLTTLRHTREFFVHANVLAIVGERPSAVSIIIDRPHFCISIAGHLLTIYGNIDTFVIVIGMCRASTGQGLFVGRVIDHHLVAVGNGGLSGWFILLNSIVESLHRALVLAQHSDGFQRHRSSGLTCDSGFASITV